MADQNITALPVATSPASSDQLLIVGATEEKLIDYEKLADAILTKLTSKTFALDQGTKSLVAALNELNSKRFKANSYIIHSDDSTKTVSVKWNSVNNHMTSLLLIDNNCITSLYITGKQTGATEISKKSEYATPPVLDTSSATLKVTLIPWSTALLICFNPVTIS